VRGQDDVDWRVEHLAQFSIVEVVFQLSLQPTGDPLVDRVRRGVHEELPLHQLVSLAVVRRCQLLRIGRRQ